jgi:uncharacterized protein (DUF924 family)
MRDAQSEILNFWFNETKPAQWFQKNPDFDQEIHIRFEMDYILASQDIYDAWMDSPKGCLALSILLDQFPRNMYRGTDKMYATDSKALKTAYHTLDKKFDGVLSPIEKVFIYLPLMHSEDINDQIKSLALFQTSQDENATYTLYAQRHFDIIKKFGRFPHRNAILGRINTKLEDEYLENNEGF